MFDLWGFLLQTLTASGVAVLLLAIKALFKDKLPPKWHFAVWGVLGVMLLIPAGWNGRYALLHWHVVVELIKGVVGEYSFSQVLFPVPVMDNKYWSGYAAFFSSKMRGDERLTKSYKLERLNLSKGDPFKYVFDFGDEWRFQCKVLRELEEQTDIPGVIRRVGESPEQYPKFDEEWMEDLPETEDMKPLTRQQIDALYASIPLNRATIARLHRYMDAATNLYGLISLDKLLEIYNSQNTPVDAGTFGMAAIAIAAEDNPYALIFRDDMPQDTVEKSLAAGEIIADYLFVDEPERDIRNLRRRSKDLSLSPEEFCTALQSIIVIDAPMKEVLAIAEAEGLTFDKYWDIGEFATLYQNLNNSTHKHANRGHTPNELFMMSHCGQKLAEKTAPVGQMSLFDEPSTKPNLTLVGITPRNAPFPCGSGRKYKNCCGKGK